MYEIKSLIFIPDNVKYIKKSIKTGSDDFLSLDEKIKKNPSLREKYRCEARILYKSTVNNAKKTKNDRPSKKTIVSHVNNVENDQVDGDKTSMDYIINLTKTEILLDFNRNVKLEKGQRPDPIKKIKHYLAKYELTPEELNSPIVKNLYAKGLVKDGSEYEVTQIRRRVDQEEEYERQRLERIKKESALSRMSSPHKDRSNLRRISGVSVEEVDMGEGLYPEHSNDMDITDYVGGRAGMSKEESEMQRLMSQIQGSEADLSNSTNANIISGMFSLGEPEGTRSM